ncbi:alpha/beta fold hydrolase (plasmid) [Caballeronia sp. NK8]|nr:alpha/beta fold hydrolase [Caballeronia sp. NK8]
MFSIHMKFDLPDLIARQGVSPDAPGNRTTDACWEDISRTDASTRAFDRSAHAALAAITSGLSPASLGLAWLDWASHLVISPGKWVALWQHAIEGLAGAAHPAAPDPRFASAQWDRWPFSAYRDAFLRIQHWFGEATTGVLGVERHHEDVIRFAARQMLDAFSPTNFVWTNPAVIEAAIDMRGANFARGARHLLEDLEDLGERLRGEHRHHGPFSPGVNLTITPGKVVWRNERCELIQYTPVTSRVASEPLLIVPSWIMKYYVLDLQPHNSLIRFLIDAGFTVFAISWRNPGAEARDVGLNDYLKQGLLAALEQVRLRCGNARVHATGYCLGGTLLAIATAAMARHGAGAGLASITLLAALTDFTEPGELGIFIDAGQLAALDALMWEQCFLDGAQMAGALQLLNARDLIWSRMMSEYLLGRRSKPNDLMSWNADTTRMPYRMHSQYLSKLFLHNDLAEGRYCVEGAPVALSDIEQPAFVVGTERDHVSPWRSVYKLQLLTHNPLTFVLTSGGTTRGSCRSRGMRDAIIVSPRARRARPIEAPKPSWPMCRPLKARGGRSGRNGCVHSRAERFRRAP